MAMKVAASNRSPRGTKPVVQAFFAAADEVPETSRPAVVKAALAMIRDQVKADREKAAAAKAKAKAAVSAKKAQAKKAAAKKAPAEAAFSPQARAKVKAKAQAKRGRKAAATASAPLDPPDGWTTEAEVATPEEESAA